MLVDSCADLTVFRLIDQFIGPDLYQVSFVFSLVPRTPFRVWSCCFAASFSVRVVLSLSSTSPPGGNQVDGLPPDFHTDAVVVGRPPLSANIYDICDFELLW